MRTVTSSGLRPSVSATPRHRLRELRRLYGEGAQRADARPLAQEISQPCQLWRSEWKARAQTATRILAPKSGGARSAAAGEPTPPSLLRRSSYGCEGRAGCGGWAIKDRRDCRASIALWPAAWRRATSHDYTLDIDATQFAAEKRELKFLGGRYAKRSARSAARNRRNCVLHIRL